MTAVRATNNLYSKPDKSFHSSLLLYECIYTHKHFSSDTVQNPLASTWLVIHALRHSANSPLWKLICNIGWYYLWQGLSGHKCVSIRKVFSSWVYLVRGCYRNLCSCSLGVTVHLGSTILTLPPLVAWVQWSSQNALSVSCDYADVMPIITKNIWIFTSFSM